MDRSNILDRNIIKIIKRRRTCKEDKASNGDK
jgi:hypothetical protein